MSYIEEVRQFSLSHPGMGITDLRYVYTTCIGDRPEISLDEMAEHFRNCLRCQRQYQYVQKSREASLGK